LSLDRGLDWQIALESVVEEKVAFFLFADIEKQSLGFLNMGKSTKTADTQLFILK